MFKILLIAISLFAFLILTSLGVLAAPAAPTAASITGKHFDRALFVIFENEDYSAAISVPFLNELAKSGATFTNFMSLTHPSQPNYVILTSGEAGNVKDDKPYSIGSANIVDLLEARGLTWKVYAENYPGNCFTGVSSGTYVRKHNPFISYADIQKNPARCANIVNAAEFDADAKANNLPNYIFYIPDINNDGHNTSVTFADQWYQKKFDAYFSDAQFMQNTIVVSTFDESDPNDPNQIYTSIIGPAVKAGTYNQALTTPSLLRLLEDNWNLGSLGQLDESASPIPNIWK